MLEGRTSNGLYKSNAGLVTMIPITIKTQISVDDNVIIFFTNFFDKIMLESQCYLFLFIFKNLVIVIKSKTKSEILLLDYSRLYQLKKIFFS